MYRIKFRFPYQPAQITYVVEGKLLWMIDSFKERGAKVLKVVRAG